MLKKATRELNIAVSVNKNYKMTLDIESASIVPSKYIYKIWLKF
jgi:hypothetical protein